MKKLCSAFLALSLCSISLPTFATEEAQAVVIYHLESNGFENFKALQPLVKNLSTEEKLDVFEEYRYGDDTVLYTFANVVSPISWGSFAQGDDESAWFTTSTGVGGLLLMALSTGLAQGATGLEDAAPSVGIYYNIGALVSGILGISLSIWSLIERFQRPEAYATEQNLMLWDALELPSTESP